MGANDVRFYGVTTSRLALAVSTITGVTSGPGVMDMMLSGFTGSPVYMAGSSIGISLMLTNGSFFPTGTVPTHIGLGPVFLSGPGATAAEVSLTKFFSDIGANGASVYPY